MATNRSSTDAARRRDGNEAKGTLIDTVLPLSFARQPLGRRDAASELRGRRVFRHSRSGADHPPPPAAEPMAHPSADPGASDDVAPLSRRPALRSFLLAGLGTAVIMAVAILGRPDPLMLIDARTQYLAFTVAQAESASMPRLTDVSLSVRDTDTHRCLSGIVEPPLEARVRYRLVDATLLVDIVPAAGHGGRRCGSAAGVERLPGPVTLTIGPRIGLSARGGRWFGRSVCRCTARRRSGGRRSRPRTPTTRSPRSRGCCSRDP